MPDRCHARAVYTWAQHEGCWCAHQGVLGACEHVGTQQMNSWFEFVPRRMDTGKIGGAIQYRTSLSTHKAQQVRKQCEQPVGAVGWRCHLLQPAEELSSRHGLSQHVEGVAVLAGCEQAEQEGRRRGGLPQSSHDVKAGNRPSPIKCISLVTSSNAAARSMVLTCPSSSKIAFSFIAWSCIA